MPDAADEAGPLGVLGGADEDPGHDLLARSHLGHHGGDVVGREPVDDGAVGFATGQAEHAGTQGGHVDRGHHGGRPTEAETPDGEGLVLLVDLLAGERLAQEPDGVADPLVGLVEGRRRSNARR